jgi:hypothetical protein
MALIRVVGVVALLTAVMAIVLAVTAPKFSGGKKHGQFAKPVMAMEFVDSPNDATSILNEMEGNGPAMCRAMQLDFGFIACYALLYIALGFLLARRNCPWAIYLACLAAVCGIASAGFDVAENLGILTIVANASSKINQEMANNTHEASLAKWILGFVATALFALTFYSLSPKVSWIGYAFTLTAIVGFAGLLYKPLLGVMGIPLLLGLLALCVVAFVWPRKLIEYSC